MKPTTVDEYIEAQDELLRPRLQAIRDIVRKQVPNVEEAIKWSSPAFQHPDGMILAMMSAHKHHIAFVVTPSAKEAVADKLGDFETGKGSLKIPHSVDIPVESIEAMIAERSREYREDGAKWM